MGAVFLRKYNTLTVTGTTAIRIPIVKRGVVDFAVSADWTPAAGDVKIAVDGTAPANVTNLPTATASGNTAYWEFVLTAAELSCKQAIVMVADAATKAVEDQAFIVETFGNASAMYQADLSAANLPANVAQWSGTNVSSPATAGIPEVNVKNVNNVSTSSVTTINANQGTTQPINFTGTAGSALAKSDMVDIAGSAVSTLSAQIGVNAVNIGGTAQTGRDLGASVLLSSGTGTGQLDFTSGVVKSSLVQILGTALTETAGQIAAAFKKLFDVAAPVLTATSVNQTGDSFARLGAPAGASVSADIAAAKVDTAAIKVQTDKLTFTVANQVDSNVLDWKSATAPAMTGDAFARLGAPAGASVSADVAAVKVDTAAVKVQTDKLAFTVANQVDANVIDWKSATAPAMTGDAFARLGAPAGASVSADVAALKADLDAGVTVATIAGTASNIKKGQALANFEFLMTDSTNHNPATGLTVTANRSIDGGAFGACTNAVTELANGIYKISLSSSDLNGNVITLRFTAAASDDQLVTIVTQP